MKDLEILKRLIAEAEEESVETTVDSETTQVKEKPKNAAFEKDPMGFILKKYHTLNEIMTELMTKDFREFVDAIFYIAPKPTTFKIQLHNGQSFFMTYMKENIYEAIISGKRYYLAGIGEKERCMMAIARLLRFGTPLKTKGAEGAEEGTRDGDNTGMEGDWAANGGAGGAAIGGGEEEIVGGEEETAGEELAENTRILEAILKEAAKPTSAANKQVINALVSKYPDKFEAQSAKNRIANKTKMSASEFEKIIKKDLKAKNIKVYPPKSGQNDSSKFDMFQFDTQFGPAELYLSGGASANLGSKFEKELVSRIKAVAGLDKSEIKDKPVLKILDALNINPKLLKADNIVAAGEKDTKRPLNFKGPQDRGDKISDIIINYKGRPYYLSIKNVSGSGIYNGGVIPGIVYNKDKSKIVFNSDIFDSNANIKKIFDIFGADPKKIVKGLNDYINKSGSNTKFEETKGNINSISKLLGSAIDYGYYYIREIPGGDVKIYNIDSPEKAMQLLGTPSGTFIKYPSKSTKITTFRVPLKNSELGLKRVDVSIRNATGGIDKPVIKINLF
jgi:hypothetical protein